MVDVILTETIRRIEFEIKTNPENYADIYSELQELMFVMRTFRDFIDNPTLEQLESMDNDERSPLFK